MITIKYKNIYDTFINHYKEEHVSPFREISEMDLNQIFIDLVNNLDIKDEYLLNYLVNYII